MNLLIVLRRKKWYSHLEEEETINDAGQLSRILICILPTEKYVTHTVIIHNVLCRCFDSKFESAGI
jgi:hypothetical protein